MTKPLEFYLRYCRYCKRIFKTPNKYGRVCPICWSENAPFFKRKTLEILQKLNPLEQKNE